MVIYMIKPNALKKSAIARMDTVQRYHLTCTVHCGQNRKDNALSYDAN